MARTPKLFANLVYEDPQAAIAFLCRAFGFELLMAVEDENGRIRHAELRMGSDILFIAAPRATDKYNMTPPANSADSIQCVCGAIEDIDSHYECAVAAGAKILTELHLAAWGARMYTCADPEGHIWNFGDYWGSPFPEAQ